jgi:hypothetical protein
MLTHYKIFHVLHHSMNVVLFPLCYHGSYFTHKVDEEQCMAHLQTSCVGQRTMFIGNNVFDYNLDSPKKVQSHKVMSEDINKYCSIILRATMLIFLV